MMTDQTTKMLVTTVDAETHSKHRLGVGVPVAAIDPEPDQPRRRFDAAEDVAR